MDSFQRKALESYRDLRDKGGKTAVWARCYAKRWLHAALLTAVGALLFSWVDVAPFATWILVGMFLGILGDGISHIRSAARFFPVLATVTTGTR